MVTSITSLCGGALTLQVPILIPVLTLRDRDFRDLTFPKIIINFIIFNNPYKQHFTFLESAPDPKYVHENSGSCVVGGITHIKLNNFGYLDMDAEKRFESLPYCVIQ